MGHLHWRTSIAISARKNDAAVVNHGVNMENFSGHKAGQEVVRSSLAEILSFVHLLKRAPDFFGSLHFTNSDCRNI
jgi:hypothetical protein